MRFDHGGDKLQKPFQARARPRLQIRDAGVFWPKTDDPLFSLVGTFPFPSSDHRLVWIDASHGGFPKN